MTTLVKKVMPIGITFLIITFLQSTSYGNFFSKKLDSEQEILVSGVWFPGATLTDPKPVKSKYFEIREGGFKASKYGARYWLLADFVQEIPKDLWVVLEIENPMNHDLPFIEEGLVKAGAKSFFYDGTEPVDGMRMFTTYDVKITLYESKAKKEVLDHFIQHIKSYVDTSTGNVLISKGMDAESR